jgi:hypothetical protein
MSGPLDQGLDEGTGDVFTPAPAPEKKTGFIENLSAGYRAALAGPGSTRSRQGAYEAEIYDQVIAALTAEGEMGEDRIPVRPGGIGYRGPKDLPVNEFGVGMLPVRRKFRNPYTGKASASQGDNPIQRLYLGGDRAEAEAIWKAIERVRQRNPGFLKHLPDETTLARMAMDRRKRIVGETGEVMARAGAAGTVGGFIGQVAGAIASGDPENFVGAGIATSAGKTVARTIIKRATTEAVLNTAAGGIALPAQMAEAEQMGQKVDAGRALAEQAAIGAVFGTVIAGAPAVGGKAVEGAKAAGEALVPLLPEGARNAVLAAALRAGTVKDRALLTDYRRLHAPQAAVSTATPEERAAVNVLERDIEAREASPLPPEADGENDTRLDALAASLGVNLAPPEMPSPAPVPRPTVREAGERRPVSYDEAVHRAEGTGKNPDSSAAGHFQFIDSTWLEYAPRVTSTAGMSRQQILGLRQNRQIAAAAERLFRADNARYLRGRGVEDSAGNLSLAHFLGKVDAAKVLRAAPDTPIGGLVSASSIKSNRNVFRNIRTAQDMVRWAHKRIGAAVSDVPARPDAVPAFDHAEPMDYMAVHPYGQSIFKPDQVETDASLMQYKSGGDEAGVTDKLASVTEWNRLLSSEILVWQSGDGRNIVVDGHQRTGLARRLYPDDPSIELPAVVLREADGITARQARVIGALRNIAIGTGSLLDNARILRDAPEGAAMIRGAERVREITGLANLSHEAFGAVLNDVIDPDIAWRIGEVAPDAPESHMALADLLLKTRVRAPAEVSAVLRQARADGFGAATSEQLTMFGDQPAESLYVPIARILLAAEKRLRDEKRTFKALTDKAGRIEGAGNKLDRKANLGKVVGSEEALAILAATANRSGPVRDALIAAARAELSGAGRADAVGQFLDALAGIDLRAAAGAVERGGVDGRASGEAGSGDAAAAPDGGVPDSLEPSLLDQALDVRAKVEAFSDPVGQAAKDQTALIEHDLRERGGVPYIDPQMLQRINGGDAIDPAIAARQAQEAQLRADSPLRPGDIDAEGTMGLSLFDAADQPRFRLDEEGDARPLGDILSDAEADDLAAAAAMECLK